MLTCFNKTVQYIDVSIQEIDEGTNFVINRLSKEQRNKWISTTSNYIASFFFKEEKF